jgi:hypothetical protein
LQKFTLSITFELAPCLITHFYVNPTAKIEFFFWTKAHTKKRKDITPMQGKESEKKKRRSKYKKDLPFSIPNSLSPISSSPQSTLFTSSPPSPRSQIPN